MEPGGHFQSIAITISAPGSFLQGVDRSEMETSILEPKGTVKDDTNGTILYGQAETCFAGATPLERHPFERYPFA